MKNYFPLGGLSYRSFNQMEKQLFLGKYRNFFFQKSFFANQLLEEIEA